MKDFEVVFLSGRCLVIKQTFSLHYTRKEHLHHSGILSPWYVIRRFDLVVLLLKLNLSDPSWNTDHPLAPAMKSQTVTRLWFL